MFVWIWQNGNNLMMGILYLLTILENNLVLPNKVKDPQTLEPKNSLGLEFSHLVSKMTYSRMLITVLLIAEK